MIAALSRQADLNRFSAHLLHNLVLELTRLELELAELKNRNLQLQGRVEMLARRGKTLEDMLGGASAGKRRREPSRRTRRVHQLLAALSYGDAIGNEALAIQRQLRAAGHESEIYAELVHPRVAQLARPLHEYAAVSSPETVCIFHFSIGSAAGRLIHHAPDRLVVVYHNITPAHFFLGFHPHLAGLCHHGRRELAAFAPRTELALGDSEFNRRELEQAGFARTAVLPIVLDLPLYERRPSPVVRRLYDDGRTNVLFVGRIIPNKKIDDLIRSFGSTRGS